MLDDCGICQKWVFGNDILIHIPLREHFRNLIVTLQSLLDQLSKILPLKPHPALQHPHNFSIALWLNIHPITEPDHIPNLNGFFIANMLEVIHEDFGQLLGLLEDRFEAIVGELSLFLMLRGKFGHYHVVCRDLVFEQGAEAVDQVQVQQAGQQVAGVQLEG